MQRLRSTWLALVGGAFLVALSVSAAFGAPPSGTDDGPRGQTIAAFVHGLVVGTDEETDDDLELEEADETLEEAELELEATEASAHGECVSAIAQDHDLVGGTNENHGGAVSEAARETCPEGGATGSRGECVNLVAQDSDATGGPNANHGGAVSEAAHECVEDTAADAEATDVESDDDDDASGTDDAEAGNGRADSAHRIGARANGKPTDKGGRGHGGEGGRP